MVVPTYPLEDMVNPAPPRFANGSVIRRLRPARVPPSLGPLGPRPATTKAKLMPYETYKLLHLVGLVMLYAAIGGVVFGRKVKEKTTGSGDGVARRRPGRDVGRRLLACWRASVPALSSGGSL